MGLDFKTFKRLALRPAVVACALVFALVLSGALVFGIPLFAGEYPEGASLVAPFAFLALAICLTYLVCGFLLNVAYGHTLPKEGSHSKPVDPVQKSSAFAPILKPGPVLLWAAVMFVCWTPYLVAQFPAAMNWDTYYQITQCYPGEYPVWVIPYEPTESLSDALFSDHHPLFDTLLYGAFARMSDHFTGSWNAGAFAFVVLQALATSVILTVSVAYIRRLDAPVWLQRVAFLFFCLVPFMGFFAAAMMKDSLFSPLFVLYFLMVLECARTHGDSLKGRRSIIVFAVLGIFLALTKKSGMHIVVGSAVLLAIVYRPCWKAYVAQAVSCIVIMCLVLPVALFPALRVIPGGTQETLGPLFQQTARYAVMYPDDVSRAERIIIDDVLGYGDLASRYDPVNADPVKFWYRYDTCTGGQLLDYLGVWAAQGLRHPDAYVSASLATAAPYLNMAEPVTIIDYTADVDHGGSDKIHRPDSLSSVHEAFIGFYNLLCSIPVVGVLFSAGLYVWVIPSIAFLTLLMRRSRRMAIFIPVALSILVCLVSPLFDGRYAQPLIEIAPLIMALCLSSNDELSESPDSAI